MPAIKNRIYGLMKRLGGSSGFRGDSQKLSHAERQLEKQQGQIRDQAEEIRNLRAHIAGGFGGEYRGVDPENVIWIFGSPRTGSTWLAFMMEEMEGQVIWREPYVGELFGRLYYNWVGEKHFGTKHFILGRHKQSWMKSLRSFVLAEATARFPNAANGGYLVVKEPNGSVGAPLIMEALPESRLVFLLRDPRDVVASSIDARKKGSWLYERRVEDGAGHTAMFEMETDAYAERVAEAYAQAVGNVREAYEKHEGPKVLIRYEDLRVDTLGTMRRLYSELLIPVNHGALVRTVEKHAWENVPAENKGEGKFHRKAQPGGWREDLTPGQIEAVERITGPLLREFYPAPDSAETCT